MNKNPKYPEIVLKVNKRGSSENAFVILSEIRRELRMRGQPMEEIQQFTDETIASDYENLLAVARKWITVEICDGGE